MESLRKHVDSLPMKKFLLLTALLHGWFFYLPARQPDTRWLVSLEPSKRFIENKSQFDGRNQLPGSEILFGIDWGVTQIYFTPNGMTFRFEQKEKMSKEEEWRREAQQFREGYYSIREQGESEAKTDVVHLEWVGSNGGVRLTGLEPSDDYFSYTVGEKNNYRSINRIRGYRRLLYENLYPGIDAEYAFHPQGGIKYKLIVHPGADVSRVRMRYSDCDKIFLDEQGCVRIGTASGDIIDHAPVAFYYRDEKNRIACRFGISENIVSFHLGSYDAGKTVIIDPWTVTPSLQFANKAYYIKADTLGNAYVYGGDSPYRLLKYDATGALRWTFTPGWSSANNWFGALAVDPSGNSYITSGTGVAISKVDSSGGLVWSNSPGNFYEYWAPTFNIDYTQLIVGGTYLVDVFSFKFYGAAFDIDLSSGAIDTFIIVAGTLVGAPNTPPFIANEIRTMCYSPNGNYYYLTLDTIGSLSPSLNFNYRDSSFYNLSYYLPYGQGGSGQGINGICATGSLLYTSDGQTLYKRSISDGSILATVIIPSGSAEVCSGVTADACGNVYVGAVGKVHKYDGDLNLIATANTPGEVYDVTVTKNAEVLACGRGFAASVNLNACRPIPPFRRVATTQTNPHCSGACTGEAAAIGMNGTPPYSYKWSNGQTTTAITGLCAGKYDVTVTDASSDSVITSVVISEPAAFSVNASSVYASGCGVSAVALPSGGVPPYTYAWSTGETSIRTSPLTRGTYSVTVQDANSCSASDTIHISNVSSFPLTMSSTGASCGTCTATATVIASGGNAPYTYLWSDGQTTQTASGLCGGTTYSVTVTETESTSGDVFWSEDFAAAGAGWTLNLPGTGSNGNSANLWVINNDTSNCSPCPSAGSGGNFLHVTCNPSDFICSASANAGTCSYSTGFPFIFDASTDKYVSSPDISTIGKTNITLRFWYISEGDGSNDYGIVRLSSNGGSSWTDLPHKYSGTSACTQAAITIPAAYENIPNFRIGFRWVNNNDLNGSDPPFLVDDIELSTPGVSVACTATDTITIAGGSPITINPQTTSVLCNDDQDGAIKLRPSGGTLPYDILWSNGDTTADISNLMPGIYSVTITDSKGCTLQDSVSLTSVSVYSVQTVSTVAPCDGTPSGSASVKIISPTTPPYAYSWSTGATTPTIVNVAPGLYGVTVSDSLGCVRVDTAEVLRGLIIQETVISPCPSLSNGSIITMVTGGVEPYSYLWNTGDMTSLLTNIGEGIYTLTVSDHNDCRGSDTIIVMPDTSGASICDTLIIYDVFTPNGDGKNDLWVADGLHRFPGSEILIFNRWGSLVFEAKPFSNGWDGRSKKGEPLPPASYYYILRLHDAKQTVYSGNVTLIR